jgi:hypothetical protein
MSRNPVNWYRRHISSRHTAGNSDTNAGRGVTQENKAVGDTTV